MGPCLALPRRAMKERKARKARMGCRLRGQFDLAMTDPDLGWRRKNRHTTNPHCYPQMWRIEGIRPRTEEIATTNMIELSICAGYHALSIWNKYTAIGRMDDKVCPNEYLESSEESDIHKYFGVRQLEWKLLERSRPFRCIEVNPCGIQGAATLAKIEQVDNKGQVDGHHRSTKTALRDEDLMTQGSTWKEGDIVQVMMHHIYSKDVKNNSIKRKHFFIDSAEIALNIVEFERQICQSKCEYSEFIRQAVKGWMLDQELTLKDKRVQKLLQEDEENGTSHPFHVYAISPTGQVFRFVPEELLLSVTSRLQDAFMTQSAF